MHGVEYRFAQSTKDFGVTWRASWLNGGGLPMAFAIACMVLTPRGPVAAQSKQPFPAEQI